MSDPGIPRKPRRAAANVYTTDDDDTNVYEDVEATHRDVSVRFTEPATDGDVTTKHVTDDHVTFYTDPDLDGDVSNVYNNPAKDDDDEAFA